LVRGLFGKDLDNLFVSVAAAATAAAATEAAESAAAVALCGVKFFMFCGVESKSLTLSA